MARSVCCGVTTNSVVESREVCRAVTAIPTVDSGDVWLGGDMLSNNIWVNGRDKRRCTVHRRVEWGCVVK